MSGQPSAGGSEHLGRIFRLNALREGRNHHRRRPRPLAAREALLHILRVEIDGDRTLRECGPISESVHIQRRVRPAIYGADGGYEHAADTADQEVRGAETELVPGDGARIAHAHLELPGGIGDRDLSVPPAERATTLPQLKRGRRLRGLEGHLEVPAVASAVEAHASLV
jgi:hypothetical protein